MLIYTNCFIQYTQNSTINNELVGQYPMNVPLKTHFRWFKKEDWSCFLHTLWLWAGKGQHASGRHKTPIAHLIQSPYVTPPPKYEDLKTFRLVFNVDLLHIQLDLLQGHFQLPVHSWLNVLWRTGVGGRNWQKSSPIYTHTFISRDTFLPTENKLWIYSVKSSWKPSKILVLAGRKERVGRKKRYNWSNKSWHRWVFS